jgi:hypothetical protein
MIYIEPRIRNFIVFSSVGADQNGKFKAVNTRVERVAVDRLARQFGNGHEGRGFVQQSAKSLVLPRCEGTSQILFF